MSESLVVIFNIQILRSVLMHLRRGEYIHNGYIQNFIKNLPAREFWKYVHYSHSYNQKSSILVLDMYILVENILTRSSRVS